MKAKNSFLRKKFWFGGPILTKLGIRMTFEAVQEFTVIDCQYK